MVGNGRILYQSQHLSRPKGCRQFSVFACLRRCGAVILVHVIAQLMDLESPGLAASSVARELSAFSTLFDYLRWWPNNPNRWDEAANYKRNEDTTPAMSDAQARSLRRH